MAIAAEQSPMAGDGERAYRRYALALLMLSCTVCYIDRQILSILLQPIKAELHLTDTQLGFLSGVPFAIFYATLGIPIAVFADRSNRRNIVAASLAVFSSMTVVCGLVTSYVQLVLARIGVAIGEAGSAPPSHSMIADMFPAQRRATAMSVYSLGINLGILLGFLAGGWLSQWFGWRVALLAVGAPGLLIALLVRFTMREPARGAADGRTRHNNEVAPSIGGVLRYLWSQHSFRHIASGCALAGLTSAAVVVWLPAYLARSFGMSSGNIGSTLALLIGVVGGCGTYLGGYWADRLSKRDVRWKTWLVALVLAGCCPASAAFYLMTDRTWALVLFALPAFCNAFFVGPSLALTLGLVAPRMRAAASAVLFFIMNAVGLGLGPLLIGRLSDYWAPTLGPNSLRYALLCVSAVWLWSAAHFLLASRTLRADLERMEADRAPRSLDPASTSLTPAADPR